jgi:hypothetical protein
MKMLDTDEALIEAYARTGIDRDAAIRAHRK